MQQPTKKRNVSNAAKLCMFKRIADNNSTRGNGATCFLCGQKGNNMASCCENPENFSKRPQGYKPQLSIDEAKKKLNKAQNKRTTGQSNNQNGKTEVRGAMVKIQGAMVECKSEFLCSTITFETMEKSTNEIVATSLLLTSDSQDLLKCKDVWIGDTGATQHSTFSASGGRNQRTCNVMI